MYKDNMCLIQTRHEKTDSSGSLCVRGMPFVAVDNIIGDFDFNGIVGLAPGKSENSYVHNLYEQG